MAARGASDPVMIVATTARLVLRHMKADDAQFLHVLLTDADFLANIGHRGVDTVADAARAIEERYRAAYTRDGFGLYIVETRAGEPIGMAGLVRRSGLDDVDLGYALLPAARGKGYALEAARAVLDHAAALGIARVVAIVDPGNARSIAVLRALDMRPDRLLRVPGFEREWMLYVPKILP